VGQGSTTPIHLTENDITKTPFSMISGSSGKYGKLNTYTHSEIFVT